MMQNMGFGFDQRAFGTMANSGAVGLSDENLAKVPVEVILDPNDPDRPKYQDNCPIC